MVDKTKRWEKKVLKSGDSRQSSNEKCVKISETVGKVNHGKPSIHSKSTSFFIILKSPNYKTRSKCCSAFSCYVSISLKLCHELEINFLQVFASWQQVRLIRK